MNHCDVIVIGGGIAGVSVAYELAADRAVCLLEMEATLAFHTTGRSAATFLESYGGPIIRRLTVSSRAFFESPADTFDTPLMTPRPLLWLAPVGSGDDVRALEAEVKPLVPSVRLVDPDEAVAMNPILRREHVELCMLEPGATELDVSALHQGYVRGLRARGGATDVSAHVVALTRAGRNWRATTHAGDEYEAPVVVNASGAWGDVVATMAGVPRVGLHPLRRTLFTVSAPAGVDSANLPLTADVAGTFYVKPEGTQYLCSPADETPSEP
ncbi:MAG TPA: FAD-binding oxidoreductase, partial [Ilumatobacteraceae bacterium]